MKVFDEDLLSNNVALTQLIILLLDYLPGLLELEAFFFFFFFFLKWKREKRKEKRGKKLFTLVPDLTFHSMLSVDSPGQTICLVSISQMIIPREYTSPFVSIFFILFIELKRKEKRKNKEKKKNEMNNVICMGEISSFRKHFGGSISWWKPCLFMNFVRSYSKSSTSYFC